MKFPLSLSAGSGTFPTFISVNLIDLLAGITLAIILIVLAFKFLARPNLSSTALLKAGRKKYWRRRFVSRFPL